MTTTVDVFAALQRIGKRSYSEECRNGPWVFTDTNSLTTDGHIAILVARSLLPSELPAAPETVASTVRKWLTLTSDDVTLTADKLRAFADIGTVCVRCKGSKVATCEKCDGAKNYECECHACGHVHDVTCDCDNGKMDCPRCTNNRIGTLLGKKVNTRLLADILGVVGDDADVRGSVINLNPDTKVPHKANECIVLRPLAGEAWTAFLMPMTDDVIAVCAYEAAL